MSCKDISPAENKNSRCGNSNCSESLRKSACKDSKRVESWPIEARSSCIVASGFERKFSSLSSRKAIEGKASNGAAQSSAKIRSSLGDLLETPPNLKAIPSGRF